MSLAPPPLPRPSTTSTTATTQMPFELSNRHDPLHETIRSRIRDLLQTNLDGFPGSYPVRFESSHFQLLADEDYFVTEKNRGVRYMLMSKFSSTTGPACYLIDRHFNITHVPDLFLPQRDHPSKYQHDTLLDGEMVEENDGDKKIHRFLVFDLIALNGTPVTKRSYKTRLGLMDQDILAIQAIKSSETKSKEPFTIERKGMQLSYGLKIILSGNNGQKHESDGLVFVPVKEPYTAGTSPKLLKWKSNATAQFQIKIIRSKERKPIYCIHIKQGNSSNNTKFYDYITPEPPTATEWHSSSPDGKIAEFWWDPKWPTQMFEKGIGLETRIGGWRFHRFREDKKETDDEATLLSIVKWRDSVVTKQQLESQTDFIRSQWKAREASSNGNTSQPSNSNHRPLVRQLSISSSIGGSHPAPMTPSLNSPFIQSPSSVSHSGAHGYFPKKERERKSSVDEYGSSNSLPSTSTMNLNLSHPLPPKPQPRHSSIDPPHSQSPNSNNSKSGQDQNSGSNPLSSPVSQASQMQDRKSTPPPPSTPTSASPISGPGIKNIQKLPISHPMKPWMTSPAPRPLLTDKLKPAKVERRDSRDSITSNDERSPRSSTPAGSISRKSSLSITEISKDTKNTLNSISKATETTSSRESSSNQTSSTLSEPHANQPQTPTPAHTPIPTGVSQPSVTPAFPMIFALPPTSLSLPNSSQRNNETKTTSVDSNIASSSSDSKEPITVEANVTKPPSSIGKHADNDDPSNKSTPVLGKRTFGPSSITGDQSEDSLAQRRKLSDGTQSSPKTEAVMTGIGTLNLFTSQSPKPVHSSPLAAQDSKKLSPLLSPLSSPGSVLANSDSKNSLASIALPNTKLATRSEPVQDVPENSGLKQMEADPQVNKNEMQIEVETSAATSVERSVEATVESSDKTPVANENQAVDIEVDLIDKLENVDQKPIVATQDVEMKDPEPVPTPELTHEERQAYEPSSDLEKQQAAEKTRMEGMIMIEKQGEIQASKYKKKHEDVVKYIEKSRNRKEKAEKRKLLEMNESPIQDRRAQPVRQINQQQSKQSNGDSTTTRAQSQDQQQRLGYQTRQSKAASRSESQQSAQNSPRVQSRAAQYSANAKEQTQPSDPTPPLSAQGGPPVQNTNPEPNTTQGEAGVRPPTPVIQKIQEQETTNRQHRRVGSNDQLSQLSRSHSPLASGQQAVPDRYEPAYTKRLDINQHGEIDHRRSNSDINNMHKAVVTFAAHSQAGAQGSPFAPGGGPTHAAQHGSPYSTHDQEFRQGMYPPHVYGSGSSLRTDMDSPRMRNNNAFNPTREPVPGRLESKAKLQFILNDDDGRQYEEDDILDQRSAYGRSNWGQHVNEQEMQGLPAQAEYSSRNPYLHEYGAHDNYAPPHSTSSSDPALGRHQMSKKPKLSQDITGIDQHYNSRVEEHEHHIRQTQNHSASSRTAQQQAQRSNIDSWAHQTHSPHSNSPHPMPSQQHPPNNHIQPPTPVRRIPTEPQAAPPGQQSIPQSNRPAYPGSEHPIHGNPPSRVDQYTIPGSGLGPGIENSRPIPERASHSRHSSLSKPGTVPEHGHLHGGSYPNSRTKVSPGHPPPEQFGRGYPPPIVQGPGPTRSTSQAQLQQAQASYHPQQQQQMPVGTSARKKLAGDHPGGFGPPPAGNAHPGYDSRQPHPQHLHPHPQGMQQQHLQHPPGRHSDQEPIHDIEAIPGYHKQLQGPSGGPGPHGYYEHEILGPNHGPGRPAIYGPQASTVQERQGVSHQQYHSGGSSHDQPYRSYPGSGASSSKEDHVRGGHTGRGSTGHLPPDHPSQRQHSQHPQHLSQHSQQQQHDYRHGPGSFHPQHQQQYAPQQKVIHVQDHPHSQYAPHHHNPAKTSSPRHGQPTGVHPGEHHDPNYRHQIPHSQGHGHGHNHSGSSW